MKSSGQRRKALFVFVEKICRRYVEKIGESMSVRSWESGVHESGKTVPGKH